MGANKSSLMDSVSVVGPSSLAQHAHSSMDIDRPFEQGIINIASTDHSAMPGGASSLRTSAANSLNGSATPIYKDGTLMHPAPTLGQAIITLRHSSSGCDPQSTQFTNPASSQWKAAAATSQLTGWDVGSSSRQTAGYTVPHGSSSSQKSGETGRLTVMCLAQKVCDAAAEGLVDSKVRQGP